MKTIECMVCRKKEELTLSEDLSFPALCALVAWQFGWQMTHKGGKTFICCPECAGIAFEVSGRWGILKKEFESRMK